MEVFDVMIENCDKCVWVVVVGFDIEVDDSNIFELFEV